MTIKKIFYNCQCIFSHEPSQASAKPIRHGLFFSWLLLSDQSLLIGITTGVERVTVKVKVILLVGETVIMLL